MTTVTRQQFESMPPQNGSDFWNQYKLLRVAFKKFPDAQQVTYSVSTGLWVNLSYQTATGETKQGTIYEIDDTRN